MAHKLRIQLIMDEKGIALDTRCAVCPNVIPPSWTWLPAPCDSFAYLFRSAPKCTSSALRPDTIAQSCTIVRAMNLHYFVTTHHDL